MSMVVSIGLSQTPQRPPVSEHRGAVAGEGKKHPGHNKEGSATGRSTQPSVGIQDEAKPATKQGDAAKQGEKANNTSGVDSFTASERAEKNKLDRDLVRYTGALAAVVVLQLL